jgi:hypothetical protein
LAREAVLKTVWCNSRGSSTLPPTAFSEWYITMQLYEICDTYFEVVTPNSIFVGQKYERVTVGCYADCGRKIIITILLSDFPKKYPVNRHIKFKCVECGHESPPVVFIDKH